MKLELPLTHPAGPGADTFCAHPWSDLVVSNQGTVSPCACGYGLLADDDGRPFNVTERSLDEVWNSATTRRLRRDMVEGRPVAGCTGCYQQEAGGAASSRTRDLATWEAGWLNDGPRTVAQVRAEARAADYAAPGGPAGLYLRMGNLCNLQCRMCNGASSSRIARDATHSVWAEAWVPSWPGEPWFRDPDVLRRHVLAHPERLRHINFYGGEPLLIKEVGDILNYLIEAGVAHQIAVSVVTNGTTNKAPWLRLTGAFQSFLVMISLDGPGKVNDYIRHPSRWESTVANLESYKQLPNVAIGASVTLQAYNALYLADLLRFLDGAGLFFYVESLLDPTYLRTSVLPPPVRRLAAGRLRAYEAADCRPDHRDHVRALVAWLEAGGDAFDEGPLREFMVFTNDLDISHGTSLRRALPELYEQITAAGFAWTAETRNARRVGVAPAHEEESPA